MASYTYCDHAEHDEPVGKFTPAVCGVCVQKIDAKHSNTLLTTKSFDSCEDHIGEFVGRAWKINHKDPLFNRIVVDPYKDAK